MPNFSINIQKQKKMDSDLSIQYLLEYLVKMHTFSMYKIDTKQYVMPEINNLKSLLTAWRLQRRNQ